MSTRRTRMLEERARPRRRGRPGLPPAGREKKRPAAFDASSRSTRPRRPSSTSSARHPHIPGGRHSISLIALHHGPLALGNPCPSGQRFRRDGSQFGADWWRRRRADLRFACRRAFSPYSNCSMYAPAWQLWYLDRNNASAEDHRTAKNPAGALRQADQPQMRPDSRRS